MITGVQYYRPPTPPPGEHEADLNRIKDMGFDAIRVWLLRGWHKVRSEEGREEADRTPLTTSGSRRRAGSRVSPMTFASGKGICI